jgi:hypothetical protein
MAVACEVDDLASSVEWCSEKGKDYLIAVGSADGSRGDFSIAVEQEGACECKYLPQKQTPSVPLEISI